MIFSGIIWSLGLEQYLTNLPNDLSIWSDAVVDRVQLKDGKQYIVKKSLAALTFITEDKTRIRLTRSIIGGDKETVLCEELGQTNDSESQKVKKQFNLYTSRQKTFSNENISLMRNIYKWAGIDFLEVYTRSGDSRIYLENLAPYFIIAQMGGWNDLFADQVRKYGIIEIDQIAFEHILNLKGYLQKRLAKIKYDLNNSMFRSELLTILLKINELISKFSDDSLSVATKNLETLIKEYSDFSIDNYFEKKFNFVFAKEKERLIDSQKLIYKKIDLTEENNPEIKKSSGLDEKREKLLVLKKERREIDEKLDFVNSQLIDDSVAIREERTKLNLYTNLKILKKDGVGLLQENYCCPTCTQNVNPERYDVKNLNESDVELSVEIKKVEISALTTSLEKRNQQRNKLLEFRESIQGEIKKFEEEFKTLDNSFSINKRYLLECSAKLSEIQSEIDKLDNFKTKTETVQNELNQKIKDISGHMENKELQIKEQEILIVKKFNQKFIEYVEKIQLTAFKLDTSGVEHKKITIDESNDYIPFLDNKPLKRYCSASDQSKIIFAYLLAMQSVACQRDGANHLGFTLFDEPIQQNPGGEYRSTIIDFFSYLSKSTEGQIIIFTKLEKGEEDKLSSSSFFQDLTGKRFLKNCS
ncbi:MAG TPA: hypothetical protein VI754_15570 [Bacteriovoracaceae bacterium]|nr:hypothetical protein [Bacteriovoracaceae bacterium]